MSFSATTAVKIAKKELTMLIIGEESVYPSRENNAYKIKWTGKDGASHEGFLMKTEYSLYLNFIKLSFISKALLTQMAEAIENQIETERNEASFDATYEG